MFCSLAKVDCFRSVYLQYHGGNLFERQTDEVAGMTPNN